MLFAVSHRMGFSTTNQTVVGYLGYLSLGMNEIGCVLYNVFEDGTHKLIIVVININELCCGVRYAERVGYGSSEGKRVLPAFLP